MCLIELANRKKLELNQKMNALESEFDDWLEKSKDENAKFAKHHTQIRAIQAMLAPRHKEIRADLDLYSPETDTDNFLGDCANSEKLILSEHRIWNYFRSKFIQRNEDVFKLYLEVADEFAWECYMPIQKTVYPDASTAKGKEPPLVFFNGGASPFSVSRDRAFEPESVIGGGITLDAETVGKLPIPMVGIPWHQVKNLPEILVIGHEVGHIVEKDFGLTAELEKHLDNALDSASDERRSAWKSWLSEIFADLYGCLAAGPAFAGTLIDFIITDKNLISEELKFSSDWGKYPTVYLRVEIILHVLKHLKFDEEIKKYEDLWRSNYTSKMPKEYLDDIKIIVPQFLNGKYQCLGGKSIPEIFSFTEQMQKNVKQIAHTLNNVKNGSVVPLTDNRLRVIFAAIRKSFEEQPENFVMDMYDKAVLTYVKNNLLKSELRFGEEKLSLETLKYKMQVYDRVGAELLKKK